MPPWGAARPTPTALGASASLAPLCRHRYKSSMLTRRSLCLAAALAPVPVLAQSGTEARFIAWLGGLKAEAIKAGVDPGTADQALSGVQLLPEVMELARNQPEFKMS